MAEIKFNRFVGINNQLAADRLSAGGEGGTELAVAENVDIDDSARLCRRKGSTLISATATHSLYGLRDSLYYRQGSALYRRDPVSGATNTVDTGLAGEMVYASHIDALYYCDGNAMRTLYDGENARPYGVIPPASAPNASAWPGGMPKGEYLATMTYIMGDGSESGAPTPTRIKVESGGIAISAPASQQAGVTHKAIYLSHAGSETLYRAAIVTNDTIDVVYGGNCQDYGVALDRLHKQNPPVAQVMALWNGRMLIGSGAFLLYSDTFKLELFDLLRQSLPFDSDVTMIAALTPDACVIGTEGGIYRLEGADIATARLVKLADYGAIRGAYVVVDGYGESMARSVLFASKRGICAVSGSGGVVNLTGTRYLPTATLAGSAVARNTKGTHQALFALR